jgi:hypothetical protein
MEFQVTLCNKRIYDFYAKNPSINFEQMSLMCIDLIENILHAATESSQLHNSYLSKQILQEMFMKTTEIGEQVQLMKSSLDTLKIELIAKTSDLKREYIDEVKTLMQGSINENIRSMLERGNEHVITKNELSIRDAMKTYSQEQSLISANLNYEQTQLFTKQIDVCNVQLLERLVFTLKDMLPEQGKTIQENVKQFVDSHMIEAKRLILLNQTSSSEIIAKITQSAQSVEERDDLLKIFLSKNKEDHVQAFIENFEKKYTLMIQSIVHNGNDKILHQITKQEVVQGKVFSELDEFLSKYRNSSYKGQLEENHLFCTLTSMFPSASIIDSSKRTSSGDFMIHRENRDDILIENKDYKRNVNTEEIQKFIVDCESQKMHGIFLSQKTGITSKKNYQIDCHRGKFLIYIHECEYLPHKIQVAFDIIDSLSKKTKEISGSTEETDSFWITKEILDDINSEYQKLITHRELMMTTLKDFHKKMTAQIEDIKIPSLEKYLLDKYATTQKQKHVCDICDLYTSNTLKGLASHKASCLKKKLATNPMKKTLASS